MIALGLTLVYGLLKILHAAHAALYTLGAYIGVTLANLTGSLAFALCAAMILVGFAGLGFYRFAYRPLLGKPPLVALIASIGIFIASEEIFRIAFGAYGMSFRNPPVQSQVLLPPAAGPPPRDREAELPQLVYLERKKARYLKRIQMIKLPHFLMSANTLAVVFVGALARLASSTRQGTAWRATVSDPEIAMSFGIVIERVRLINFFIGSNGACKTATILALAGPIAEFGGSISMRGRDIAGLAPMDRSRLGIALVPEGRRVFADLAVMKT